MEAKWVDRDSGEGHPCPSISNRTLPRACNHDQSLALNALSQPVIVILARKA
jgi:hypothetical protein